MQLNNLSGRVEMIDRSGKLLGACSQIVITDVKNVKYGGSSYQESPYLTQMLVSTKDPQTQIQAGRIKARLSACPRKTSGNWLIQGNGITKNPRKKAKIKGTELVLLGSTTLFSLLVVQSEVLIFMLFKGVISLLGSTLHLFS